MSATRYQPLFTIGHSNHSIEHFLALLRRHGVEMIADVRSRPYSRFVPHFSKERLARLLEEEGLGYLYLGRELGGKPPKGEPPASPTTYQLRVEQPLFRQGIDRLLEAAWANRVALLCRERDPLDCHRLHLVCRYLRPLGLDVRHILPSGELEAQPATERRLLERVGNAELPLFGDLAEHGSEQNLARAYDSWWHIT
jgi:uncharacterized protein (DUF488 family)